MSNRACLLRKEVFSSSGITAAVAGARISIPIGIGRWYIRLQMTEDSAGAITVTLKGNETDSTTGAYNLHTFGATVSSTTARVDDANADGGETNDLLPPWIYLDLSVVSGEWTAVCELYYSKLDVS